MRAKTSFSCQSCGHQSPRWIGRCPDCGGWNTMKEERQAPTGKGRPVAMKMAQAKATPIAEIEVVGEDRRLTQISEFDRVLEEARGCRLSTGALPAPMAAGWNDALRIVATSTGASTSTVTMALPA